MGSSKLESRRTEVSLGQRSGGSRKHEVLLIALEELGHLHFNKMKNGRNKGKTVLKLEVQGDDLIPGMPNDITLNQILTKLPLLEIHILPSVNRGWLQAIRSRQVYEARVRSNSTESLAVIVHNIDYKVNCISLYSVRDERLYDVPPIQQLGGIPADSQCVSLDGKLYVLGGLKNSHPNIASDEVYVLDLAGQRGWRRCASMQQPRHYFECSVMNGKIYACGGHSWLKPVERPEVYDPEVDAWSQLPPMLSLRFKPRVETFGEQLIVLGGNRFDHLSEGYVEVYNPIEEKWQFVAPGSKFLPGSKFSAQDLMFAREKIYSVTWSDIHVQEGQDRWTHLHSLSSKSSVKSRDSYSIMRSVPVIVEDELLTLLDWAKSPRYLPSRTSLVRSRGFSSGKKEIVWEDAPWSGSKKYDGLFMNDIMCTIRL